MEKESTTMERDDSVRLSLRLKDDVNTTNCTPGGILLDLDGHSSRPDNYIGQTSCEEKPEVNPDIVDIMRRPNIELSSDDLDRKIKYYLNETKESFYVEHPELDESSEETPSPYANINCCDPFVPLGPTLPGTLGGASEALRVCREGTPEEKEFQKSLAKIELGERVYSDGDSIFYREHIVKPYKIEPARCIYGDVDPTFHQVFPADSKSFTLTNPPVDCSNPRLPDGTSLSDQMTSAQLHDHHFPVGMKLEDEPVYAKIRDITKSPKKKYATSPSNDRGSVPTPDEIKRKSPAGAILESHADSEQVGRVKPLTYRDLATCPTVEQIQTILDYTETISDGEPGKAVRPRLDYGDILREPDEKDTINPTLAKELTGDDAIYCFPEETKRPHDIIIKEEARYCFPEPPQLYDTPIPIQEMPTEYKESSDAEKTRLHRQSKENEKLTDLIKPGTKGKHTSRIMANQMFGFGFGRDISQMFEPSPKDDFEGETEPYVPEPEMKGPREVNLKPGSTMRRCQHCHSMEGQELIDEMIQCNCKEHYYCDQECRDRDLYYHPTCFVLCGCGKKSKSRCGRCKMKRYCSRECQKQDWSSHKRNCVPPK